MRVGQNPAKTIGHVAQPERVTVAVTTYIPFVGGYYAHSLEVLEVCLASILANSDRPFDLMVVDNASCEQAVQYLAGLQEQEKIQYLFLLKKNLGKVGAWNLIFGAAPGEYIAYSDMDVFYCPGWLSKHLLVFDAFPEAGTVAGLPRRGDLALYTSTIRQLPDLPGAVVEKGRLIPDEWILDHAASLGKTQADIVEEFALPDYRATRQGVAAYATGTHFQFMVRSDVVRQYIPFANRRPMGDSVAQFDQAIDGDHRLRLATAERTVVHMGNRISEQVLALSSGDARPASDWKRKRSTAQKGSPLQKLASVKPLRKVLLALYDRIFRLYYE